MNTKRLFDLFFAATGIILFMPAMLLIAGLILMEDGRPCFFMQERLGRGLRPFTIIKFRSMRNGRITRIGRWTRGSGLDEVLQFINVLHGSMSMVGPRPLTARDAERLGMHREGQARNRIKPGITGLSQLYAGRGKKVSIFLDNKYVREQSLSLDVKILTLSFLVNIFGKGRIRDRLERCRKR